MAARRSIDLEPVTMTTRGTDGHDARPASRGIQLIFPRLGLPARRPYLMADN
jgi:hypothetical protein